MLDREYAAAIRSWLTHQVTVAQAEAESLASIRETNRMPPYPGWPRVEPIPEVPFGHVHADWQQFLAQAQRGDTLWHFRSPPQTWQALAGREGYALVRNGWPVDAFVTVMN